MKKLLILLAVAVIATSLAFAQDGMDGQRSTESNAGRTSSSGINSGGTSIERFNAEINIGFPIHWTNGHHDFIDDTNKTEDKTVTASTSIGIGLTFNFTNKVGLILEGDFFYGAELTGISDPTSDYISLTGGNLFVGPLFYLFNNNVFRIPLGAGFHMYGFSDSLWVPFLENGAWISRNDLQFGIGASIGFQFHFETGVYLFSRTNVTLDFIRIHSISGYPYTETETFTPDATTTTVSGNSTTTVTSPESTVNGTIPGNCVDLFNFMSWNVKPSIGIGIRF